MRITYPVSVSAALFGVTLALKTFDPQCTAPDEAANFVKSPNARGTYDILWNSMFTLFICTLTVQHLNISHKSDTKIDTSVRGKIRAMLQEGWPKIMWMLIVIIAPEFLVAFSFQDWMLVRDFFKTVYMIDGRGISSWSKTHVLYANMGGFVITLKRSKRLCYKDDITLYLSAIQLYVAKELGIINELPDMLEIDIQDKNKGDLFVKGTAVIQLTNFLIRFITRMAKRLPISQLETAVFAFCLCTFIAYFFYWSKPQSVMVPTPIKYDRGDPPRDVLDDDIKILEIFGSLSFIKTTFVPPFRSDRRKPTELITNDMMDGVFFVVGGVFTHYAESAAVLGGVLFGALYSIAWSFPFPSRVEMILWRVATVAVAVGPVVYNIANVVFTMAFQGNPKNKRHAAGLYTIAVIYLLGRIFLIVEMFRTLFFLPPRAFV
ncbi:hypothetical protein K432DRAFT_300724 [Lepidopterella palustris CBS 459.81]|uniref:Uncharacterized protein n=1 Tax=Lepidopterella palustris CBS 459.81 TaxID=1314670 RepID=A0A8E2E7T7_9PEZI|nr:hypothetical protein K432DRAFT_300724 [Lepidopterella palustris CBS 459.81]